jgi:alanyl-tRNA synthetase
MTERLYYTDAYLREFDGAVVDSADGGRRIYLDRTAFYPSSGGQPFDTGRLGEVDVLDVVDEGDRIAHLLAEPMTDPRPIGRIDWARRFDHMQQHTGQHLLSAVLAEQLGCATTGVHFGRDISTLDLNLSSIDPDQLLRAEERANQIVVENRPVEVSFESAEQASGLRKASTRSGSLRIITIPHIDRSACGGTHVRATGEIGAILIRGIERVRKSVRMEFLCGARAVRHARQDYLLLGRLAGAFSAPASELPHLVEDLRQEIRGAATARRELQGRYDLCRARELHAATQPDAAGIRRIVVRDTGETLEALRGLGQALASLPAVLFVGAVSAPPSLVVAASPGAGVDAGRALRELLVKAGGRGGGSATLAQGTVPDGARLDSVVNSLVG